MRHNLALSMIETANLYTLRISDSSVYADFPATCGLLQIQVPGFNFAKEMEVIPTFSLVFNACSLGIQTSNCGVTVGELPDGIYRVRYSVSPNDQVYVEYAFLRTTAFMTKYYQTLCNLDVMGCEPSQQVKDGLDKLQTIKMFLDAAVAEVEYCHDLEKGMQIFNYAKAQLDKISLSCCSNC